MYTSLPSPARKRYGRPAGAFWMIGEKTLQQMQEFRPRWIIFPSFFFGSVVITSRGFWRSPSALYGASAACLTASSGHVSGASLIGFPGNGHKGLRDTFLGGEVPSRFPGSH